MKKYFTIALIAITLGGCGTRNTPDELTVVKYQELVMPKNINVLPVPNAQGNALGYETAQQSVKEILQIQNTENTDSAIFGALKIKKVDKSIRINIKALGKSSIIVDAKKEEKRIADNKKSGKSITNGKTPTINISKEKAGIDELFD